MATIASSNRSSSTIYENLSDVQSLGSPLEELRLEDSGTFDGESPTDSSEQIDVASCSPVAEKYTDDKHIYTNIREMDEINNRPLPPAPSESDQPKRNLNNGWMEYETEAGRTYFYNSESGKSQWIPPRFIRTPAQVEAFLKATKTEMDEYSEHTSSETPILVPEEASEGDTFVPEKKVSIGSEAPSVRKLSAHYDVPPGSSFDEVLVRSRQNSENVAANEVENENTFLPISHQAKNSDDSAMMTSFSNSVGSAVDPLCMLVQNTAGPSRVPSSPSTTRSQSFKHRHCQLKNVPLPQVLPNTSGFHAYDAVPCMSLDRPIPRRSCDDSDGDDRRGSSGESREPVRNIRHGNMEKIQTESLDHARTKRREWQANFMYLTSAHLILYKDEKSAEKHGNHYAPPLGVCDLRGATVSWNIEKERRKRKVIQLELSYGPKYLLRTSHDTETQDWFDSLRDVVAKLPAAAPSAGLPLHPSVLDPSCAVVRNPSTLSNRPHSTALVSSSRSSRRGDPMAQSSIETGSGGEEPAVSRQTILDRLKRFFRTRPSVESLKEKGIYKPEPVFGSTISNICQLEHSLVPKFIRTVTELIENKGLEVDGLYRVSGNLSAVQRIRCQVDQDKYTNLVNEEDVHVLTGALKLFFRELAEPLFPSSQTKEYLSAIKLQITRQRFKRFDELLKMLPVENRETLKMLLRHLHRVAAHSDKNRMQTHNLAIMFGPTLFGAGEEKTKKKDAKGKGRNNKKDNPAPVQSNSHMAFNMIMQGQIVEYLLNEHSRFDALQGPIQTHP